MKPDPYKKKASRRYHARKGISKKATEESTPKTTEGSNNNSICTNNQETNNNVDSSTDSTSNSKDASVISSASISDNEVIPLNPENKNKAPPEDPNSNSPTLKNPLPSNNSFFLEEADLEAIELEKAEEEEKKQVLQNFSSILKEKLENAEEKKTDELSFFRTKKGRNGKFKGKKVTATSDQSVENIRISSAENNVKAGEKAFVKRLKDYKLSSEHNNFLSGAQSSNKFITQTGDVPSFDTLIDEASVTNNKTLNNDKKEASCEELPNSASLIDDNSLDNKNALLSQAEDFLDDLLNQDIDYATSKQTNVKQPEKSFNETQPPQNISTKVSIITRHPNIEEVDLEAMLDDLLM